VRKLRNNKGEQGRRKKVTGKEEKKGCPHKGKVVCDAISGVPQCGTPPINTKLVACHKLECHY
jgi:hypothetical protein